MVNDSQSGGVAISNPEIAGGAAWPARIIAADVAMEAN